MSRRLKSKKDKVPKLTEEEYVKYITALKGEDERRVNVEQPHGTVDRPIGNSLQS